MARQRCLRHRAAGLVGIVLGCLVGVGAAADDTPQTLTERMERELLRCRVQIQNARFRLERGLQGAFSDGLEPAGEPRTPVQSCCAVNLTKMSGAVGELGVIFDALAACHEAGGNLGAVSTARIARNDLGLFSRGVDALAEAPGEAEALGVLSGLTQAYLVLLETTEKIEPCAPRETGPPDPAAEQPKKKKDKPKKRKAKQTEERSGG